MHDSQAFKFTNAVVFAPLVGVLSIWSVYWVELLTHSNFNEMGIYPQKLSGLKGILFSPFIHGSLDHLYNNTLPLAILLAALFYFYRSVALKVVVWGILLSGVVTWIIGRPSYHIGASSIIYVLASFIFFKGILAKHFRLVALSMVVVFLYGSLLWYIFPVKDGISWEGHLGGFIAGLIFAFIMKVPLPKVRKYAWEGEDYNEEDDPFLKHFDDEGNFVPSVDDKELEDEVTFNYHYMENPPNKTSDSE